jgi:hypothetical protein
VPIYTLFHKLAFQLVMQVYLSVLEYKIFGFSSSSQVLLRHHHQNLHPKVCRNGSTIIARTTFSPPVSSTVKLFGKFLLIQFFKRHRMILFKSGSPFTLSINLRYSGIAVLEPSPYAPVRK